MQWGSRITTNILRHHHHHSASVLIVSQSAPEIQRWYESLTIPNEFHRKIHDSINCGTIADSESLKLGHILSDSINLNVEPVAEPCKLY